MTNKSPSVTWDQFERFAKNEIDIWRELEGKRVKHTKYGFGRVANLHRGKYDIEFYVEFKDGRTGPYEIRPSGRHAFWAKEYFSKVEIPNSLDRKIAVLEQQLELLREQAKKHEKQLEQHLEQERVKADLSQRAIIDASAERQRVDELEVRIKSGLPVVPDEQQFLFGAQQFEMLATYWEREAQIFLFDAFRTTASKFWRYAGKPDEAIRVTDGWTGQNARTEAARLTTRGAAFCDTGRFLQAEELGRQALTLISGDKYACRLLGKVYVCMGRYTEADLFFQQAGITNEKKAREIQGILTTVDESLKQSILNYLGRAIQL